MTVGELVSMWTDVHGGSFGIMILAMMGIAILWGVGTGVADAAFDMGTKVEQLLVTASTPFLTRALLHGAGLILGLSLALVFLGIVATLASSWASVTLCK